ncbi:unnamed protein product [Sphagnum jensenii]|uniref:HAT C-terminal dimerisation domain-containing protein n=1 Tax=Sphagnum jensenii TaxID=128206 RepID=A0ABP1B2V4_9BRYO
MGSPAYGVANPEELASPFRFWDFVKFTFKGSCLARLALVILSIITNMATCEHLFSELVQIHTARHNRLKPNKVEKLSIVHQAVRKKNTIELQSQEVSASTHGCIIEAKERKIMGAVDDGDQENAVDVQMEEERVEQKEDDQEHDGEEENVQMEEERVEQKEDNQEQDGEEEKEEPVEEQIDHVLFEWSSILGLGMGEDTNDDEGLEVVEEGQVLPAPEKARPCVRAQVVKKKDLHIQVESWGSWVPSSEPSFELVVERLAHPSGVLGELRTRF